MRGKASVTAVGALVALLLAITTYGVAAQDEEGGRWQEPIVIGWTPPDITGVFKTATDFFDKSAADANANGFAVEVIAQSPATHVAFSDQVAIIEDYIQRGV